MKQNIIIVITRSVTIKAKIEVARYFKARIIQFRALIKCNAVVLTGIVAKIAIA